MFLFLIILSVCYVFIKVDKVGADAESVMSQLMREGVVVEELGGDCQCCLVSSVSGSGIAQLLEKIALQVDLFLIVTYLSQYFQCVHSVPFV